MKKLLPLLILTLFLGACAPTVRPPVLPEDGIKHTLISSSDTRYEGVITEGTKEKGSGVFIVQSGEKKGNWYEGGFLGENFHGQGTLTTPNGEKYVGGWKDGLRNGQGTATFPSGEKYEGEYKDGNYHGQGTFTYPDGSKYVGEFKDGKYNGQGTFTFANGGKYVGEWKDGKYNGQGTFTFANGGKYVGEWKDGKYNGQGTSTFPDGRKYVGEFKDGKYNGQGTSTFPDGRKYVGEFKDGKYNGQGTSTFPDGRKYVGEWKNSNFGGKGVLFKVSGEIESGIFNDGNFQTPWTIEAVSNYLKNKYPEFLGFDSETSSPVASSVKSSGASISGFIAVLEFEGNNISSGEVRALTDRLRSELVGTGQLTIIERGKMEEILKEQSFQQTGCVSSECAVEVGKLLGVEQIVMGNISKVGTFFSVTARVVSVQSGEIVRSTIYDHSGDIGGLLTQGMKKVAEELGK